MSSSTILFTYNNKTIKDVVQLNAYMKTTVGESLRYVNYVPSKQQVVVAAVLGTFTSQNGLQQVISDALAAYTDPNPPETAGGIQTGATLRLNSFASYTGSVVSSNAVLSMSNNRITDLAAPMSPTDAVPRGFVDAISAGNGLTKDPIGPTFSVNVDSSLYFNGDNEIGISSNALSTGLSGGNGAPITVLASQPQITRIGTLTSLTVSGLIVASAGLSAEGNKIINVANPVDPLDCANRQYVDSTIHFAAGNALSSIGTLLSVNVDAFSLQIYNNALRVNPNFIGYGLSGGGATQLSVNANQPSIVSLGTLTSLTVAGPTRITDTTDSVGADSGAVQVSGGAGFAKSVYVAGSAFIGNGLNVNGKVISNVATPIVSTDGVNRGYVDGIITTPGAGIVKTGTTVSANVDGTSLEISPTNTIRIASSALGTGLTGGSGSVVSVVADQSQITRVGTLVSLNVAGNTTITSGTNVTGSNTGSLQTLGGVYVAKDILVDGNGTISGNFAIVGSLNASGTTTITNSSDASGLGTGALVLQGGASIAKSLQIGGILNMNAQRVVNVAAPTAATDSANRAYVDSLVVTAGNGLSKTGTVISAVVDGSSIEIFNNTMRVASSIAGTGLTGGSGSPLSIVPAQPQITTVGLLSSLSVNGAIMAYSGINVNNARITSVGSPIVATDAATRGFVDSTRPTPGAGLIAGTGTNLDVNVDATSLEVAGNNTVRIASGALGTGLTGGSGTPIAVVASQPQIVTVGTLTDLAVDGMVTFNNTTDATSAVSGPMYAAGGISVGKSLFVGGSFHALSNSVVTGTSSFLGASVFVDSVSLLKTDDSTSASTGALVAAGGIASGASVFATTGFSLPNDHRIHSPVAGFLRVDHNDTTVGNDVVSFGNTSLVDTQYVTRMRLWNLGNENASDGEYLEMMAASDGARVRSVGKGGGAVRTLILNEFLSIDATGQISSLGTANSTSPTTGSLAIINGGGLGVDGDAHVGGTLVAHGGIDANAQRITNVARPVNLSDAVNLAYVNDVAQGLSVKPSVVAASTGPVTLTSVMAGYTLDGVTLAAGDRVLLKDQSNSVENGIYVVGTSGPPVRPPEMGTGVSAMGAFVFVESGTVNHASGWVNSTPGAGDTVGTDPLQFTQFSGAGEITAGIALSKNGNILDVNVDGTSIESYNDTLRVASGIAGTGLSGGSGVRLSVNPNLPFVTGLGTVTSGTWNANVVSVPYGGTGATSFSATQVLLGNDAGPLSTSSDFYYTGTRLSAPNLILTATTGSVSAGSGALVVRGGVGIAGNINVIGTASFAATVSVPDPVNPSDASSRRYVDSVISTAGTGLSKIGTTFSVNNTLPNVVTVGTLLGLTSSGAVLITDGTDSTSATTGSISTAGGIGVTKSAFIGGNLMVSGSTMLGYTTVGTPSDPNQITNKAYVDSLVSTAGVGLTKTGNSFSVNSSLGNVTSVGTLTGLNVAGIVSITDGSNAGNGTSGAFRVTGGVGIGKDLYVGGLVNVGSTMSVTGSVSITNASQSNSATSGALVVSGGIGTSGNIFTMGSLNVQSGLQSGSVGTGAVVVNGGVGIGGNLYVAGNVVIPDPIADNQGASKGYVDRNLSTAGIGLTKTGTTLSVNAQLDDVTRIGTQTVLSVSGVSTFSNTTPSTSTTSGAVVISGGMGLAGDLYTSGNVSTSGIMTLSNTGSGALQVTGGASVGGSLAVHTNLAVTGNSVFTGKVTIPAVPVNGTDAVSKSYADGLSYLTAGTGLNKSGAILSINSAQPTITSVGTLTSLTVSGTVIIPTAVNANEAVRKDYVDGLSYLTAGTGLTKTGNTLTVNSAQPSITSLGTVTGLTSSGAVHITDTTVSNDPSTGALTVGGGLGVGGSVNVAGSFSCAKVNLSKVSLVGSSASDASPYTLTLPKASPVDNSVMLSQANGTASFLPLPITKFFNNGVLSSNVALYCTTVVSQGGTATVNVTDDGTTAGNAVLSSILFAIGMPLTDTTIAPNTPECSLKSISTDSKTVVFNVVVGTTGAYNSKQFAPNGTKVYVLIYGNPLT